MAKFNLWTWFKNIFKNVKKHGAQVAITITEQVKDALNTGAAGFIALTVDNLANTHLAENVLSILRTNIPKLLAVELAVQGLPDNPTKEDILKFETDVINAFGKMDKKSKFYTTFAADVYGIVKETLETTPDKKPTFAELVAAVEKAYERYLIDKVNSDV